MSIQTNPKTSNRFARKSPTVFSPNRDVNTRMFGKVGFTR